MDQNEKCGGLWLFDDFLTRKGPSPSFRNYIQTNGKKRIFNITICKDPIAKSVDTILSWISLGQFDKNKSSLNYDKMFHLYLVLILEDGTEARLEKNQVISLTNYGGPSDTTTSLNVFQEKKNVIVGVTLQESRDMRRKDRPDEVKEKLKENLDYGSSFTLAGFIAAGIEDLANKGKDPWGYEGASNNCQIFVKSMLDGNNLSTSETNHFIIQDTLTLINDLPTLTKGLMNEAISAARFIDTLLNGY